MKYPEKFGVNADVTVLYNKKADLVCFRPHTIAADRLLNTYPVYQGGDLVVSTDLSRGVLEEFELAGLCLMQVHLGNSNSDVSRWNMEVE